MTAGMLLLFATLGCAMRPTPYPLSFNSSRPEERSAAAKHAARIGDRDVIGLLVDRLEDEDAAVRFYAILALEKLTGTRRGYAYYHPESQRYRAVQSWRRYVARGMPGAEEENDPPASGPTG